MAGTIYSNCSTITTGCYLYNNTCLTSPASNGYYSDGTNCFTVTGGSGYISSVSSCPSSGYYHYGVTTFECSGFSCQLSSYTPAFGLIASSTPLTVDSPPVYYLDNNTSYIFRVDSYYGFGNYGGLIIVIGGSNYDCDLLCSIV